MAHADIARPQVDMVLSPSASYIVDIMHDKSAESMAVNKWAP